MGSMARIFSIASLGLLSLGLGLKAAGAPERLEPGGSPEMQRLAKLYLGKWSYVEKYKRAENTGIYTSELGPGGNSLINRFHSRGPAGEFEGLLVMTWDAKEKAYKEYVFGDQSPGALVETGQFVGDALEFKAEMVAGENKISLRNSTHSDAAGHLISEQFSSASGKAETLFVQVTATREP